MATDVSHDAEAVVTIPLGALLKASQDLTGAEQQRERARALAARLEEVVAMRTAVISAIIHWYRSDGRDQCAQLEALILWAEAQLAEVP